MIIVDPFFNKTFENQALGRVVRRGQAKETYLVRIFAEETYDNRIFDIQTHRFELVQEILQDDLHVPKVINDKQLQEILLPKPFRIVETDLGEDGPC